jgi:hypothetical protein
LLKNLTAVSVSVSHNDNIKRLAPKATS